VQTTSYKIVFTYHYLKSCLFISFSVLNFCPFSAFLKSDRENEEHVYADLIDVCSSNDHSSGQL